MSDEEKFMVTEDDFRKDLEKHLYALANAADRFDAGDTASVDDLVLRIWKIIGDRYDAAGNVKKNQPSILTRLQVKPSEVVDISFHFNLERFRYLRGPFFALGILPVGERDHIALLDGFEDHPEFYANCKTEFLTWWNAPILRDGHGSIFSRRSIIETMRDKEIMHSDISLPMSYGRLVYHNSVNIRSAQLHVEPTSRNIVNVVVRQVAHELLRTFLHEYPKRFSIKSGKIANPMVFVEHGYTNAVSENVRIYDYNAYKYVTIWAKSTEDAEAYMSQNPVRQPLTSKYIEFYAERVPSSFFPTEARLAYCNYYPVETRLISSHLGNFDGEAIAVITVLNQTE